MTLPQIRQPKHLAAKLHAAPALPQRLLQFGLLTPASAAGVPLLRSRAL